MDFGAITAVGRSTSNPISRSIIQKFDYEYGNRSGINFFMDEYAQRETARERYGCENLFTIG